MANEYASFNVRLPRLILTEALHATHHEGQLLSRSKYFVILEVRFSGVHFVHCYQHISELVYLVTNFLAQAFSATAVDIFGADEHRLCVDRAHGRNRVFQAQACAFHGALKLVDGLKLPV